MANLLTNAAWNKKSVLFSSKNNKAVDVVEKRVNSLCSRPVMLRLGNDKYANRLAELVTDCLSYNSAEDDKSIYKQRKKEYQLKLAEYNQLFQEKARIMLNKPSAHCVKTGRNGFALSILTVFMTVMQLISNTEGHIMIFRLLKTPFSQNCSGLYLENARKAT